jgi:transformation/transcription domain-associated protein
MEQHTCLFVRDETINWLHTQKRPWNVDIAFRTMVNNTIDAMFKRAEAMACKIEREQVIYKFFLLAIVTD